VLIDTDAVHVHYEWAQNIIGSGTKMTIRGTEYRARVKISNGLYCKRWGARGCPCQGATYFPVLSRMISTAIEPRPLQHEEPQGRSNHSCVL
jgi:hypothetical protein